MVIHGDNAVATPLSLSQKNILAGSLEAQSPSDYLVEKIYHVSQGASVDIVLSALQKLVEVFPILRCVVRPVGDGYGLVPAIAVSDIVCDVQGAHTSLSLDQEWQHTVFDAPLTQFLVDAPHGVGDSDCIRVILQAHHLVLDGGAVQLLEEAMGRLMQKHADEGAFEGALSPQSMDDVSKAHLYEHQKCAAVRDRGIELVREELGKYPRSFVSSGAIRDSDVLMVARGSELCSSTVISGDRYDVISEAMSAHGMALDVACAAAAVAVHAGDAQTTATNIFQAVNPRFGHRELNVPTCLVNTVWSPIEFPANVSAAGLYDLCDRSLASARRRTWVREELVHRELWRSGTPTDGFIMNFHPSPVHDALRAFLLKSPEVTKIGPIEQTAFVFIHDEQERALTIQEWRPSGSRAEIISDQQTAGRLADYLTESVAFPLRPAAVLVGEWHTLTGGADIGDVPATWCELAGFSSERLLCQRPGIDEWLAFLRENDVPDASVAVFEAELSEKTVDLLLALHLTGRGYSPCRHRNEVDDRVRALRAEGITAWAIDGVSGANPTLTLVPIEVPTTAVQELSARDTVASGSARVQGQSAYAQATHLAYVLPTSGTTGVPKLVRITHANLAAFLAGARQVYGWNSRDTVAHSASLLSDISVEEIFLAALVGARIVCLGSDALKDPDIMVKELHRESVTVADWPTTFWHSLTADDQMMHKLNSSSLRLVVIGGEAVNASALHAWQRAVPRVGVLSTYGPTEGTVVATAVPLHGPQPYPSTTVERATQPGSVGHPLLRDSVAIAFGEIVLCGRAVSPGYLAHNSPAFRVDAGCVSSRMPTYATRDRVRQHSTTGDWVFAGRSDATVKVAGQRVDLFELYKEAESVPAVRDIFACVDQGKLLVWVQLNGTTSGKEVYRALRLAGFPVSTVIALTKIPRDERGVVQTEELAHHNGSDEPWEAKYLPVDGDEGAIQERATVLAAAWSAELSMKIDPADSLVDLAITSLDLIKLLPVTRKILHQHVGVRDLILHHDARTLCTQKTAASLEDAGDQERGGISSKTTLVSNPRNIATTASSLTVSLPPVPAPSSEQRSRLERRQRPNSGGAAIMLLGATGTVGRAVARAWLHNPRGRLVIPLRGKTPGDDLWQELAQHPGAQIIDNLGSWRQSTTAIDELIDVEYVEFVVNCSGNTSSLASEDALRDINVDFPLWLAQTCQRRGSRLIQLSSTVVAQNYRTVEVTVPGAAHFPYANSKIAGEVALAGQPNVTVIRLPRVLPVEPGGHLDLLLSLLGVCQKIGSYPHVSLQEEVVTADHVGRALLSETYCGWQNNTGGRAEIEKAGTEHNTSSELIIYGGKTISYEQILPMAASTAEDLERWKNTLDNSELCHTSPETWALMDEWVRLYQKFDVNPWSSIDSIALDYSALIERELNGDLRDTDILARANAV